MEDQELYDLYIKHIWAGLPDVYRDEVDMCEKPILAGIKTIAGLAFARGKRAGRPLVIGDTSWCKHGVGEIVMVGGLVGLRCSICGAFVPDKEPA